MSVNAVVSSIIEDMRKDLQKRCKLYGLSHSDFYRDGRFTGILNGLDHRSEHCATDFMLAMAYYADGIAHLERNRSEFICTRCHLRQDAPKADAGF